MGKPDSQSNWCWHCELLPARCLRHVPTSCIGRYTTYIWQLLRKRNMNECMYICMYVLTSYYYYHHNHHHHQPFTLSSYVHNKMSERLACRASSYQLTLDSTEMMIHIPMQNRQSSNPQERDPKRCQCLQMLSQPQTSHDDSRSSRSRYPSISSNCWL